MLFNFYKNSALQGISVTFYWDRKQLSRPEKRYSHLQCLHICSACNQKLLLPNSFPIKLVLTSEFYLTLQITFLYVLLLYWPNCAGFIHKLENVHWRTTLGEKNVPIHLISVSPIVFLTSKITTSGNERFPLLHVILFSSFATSCIVKMVDSSVEVMYCMVRPKYLNLSFYYLVNQRNLWIEQTYFKNIYFLLSSLNWTMCLFNTVFANLDCIQSSYVWNLVFKNNSNSGIGRKRIEKQVHNSLRCKARGS